MKNKEISDKVRIPKTWDQYEKEVRRIEEELELSTSDAQGVVDLALMNAGIDLATLKEKNG